MQSISTSPLMCIFHLNVPHCMLSTPNTPMKSAPLQPAFFLSYTLISTQRQPLMLQPTNKSLVWGLLCVVIFTTILGLPSNCQDFLLTQHLTLMSWLEQNFLVSVLYFGVWAALGTCPWSPIHPQQTNLPAHTLCHPPAARVHFPFG